MTMILNHISPHNLTLREVRVRIADLLATQSPETLTNLSWIALDETKTPLSPTRFIRFIPAEPHPEQLAQQAMEEDLG
jgi:hypothetical protein